MSGESGVDRVSSLEGWARSPFINGDDGGILGEGKSRGETLRGERTLPGGAVFFKNSASSAVSVRSVRVSAVLAVFQRGDAGT